MTRLGILGMPARFLSVAAPLSLFACSALCRLRRPRAVDVLHAD